MARLTMIVRAFWRNRLTTDDTYRLVVKFYEHAWEVRRRRASCYAATAIAKRSFMDQADASS
jgi:hypothetical protein